jgi:hypothetical protein
MSDLIRELTLDGLRGLLQQAGYRAEPFTDPANQQTILRSATGGVAFEIRPGNRTGQGGEGQPFVDFAFVAGIKVESALALDIVNRWNAQRRFARLHLVPGLLLLALDVSLIGGVAPDHVRAHIEIWDKLLPDLIAFLREELVRHAGERAPAD